MNFKNKALYFFNNVKAKETSQVEIEKILNHFGVSRIFIGHSIVDDIRSDYEGKVIKIDIKHGTSMLSGKTKGIIVKERVIYKIDDLSKRSVLYEKL